MTASGKVATISVDSAADSLNGDTYGSPERRLILAILERAILDFVGNDKREIQEAGAWIFSKEDDVDSEFSFQWVCSELGLNPRMVSDYIEQMPKRGESRLAPWYQYKATGTEWEQRDAA